jgi:hypothetical protein
MLLYKTRYVAGIFWGKEKRIKFIYLATEANKHNE